MIPDEEKEPSDEWGLDDILKGGTAEIQSLLDQIQTPQENLLRMTRQYHDTAKRLGFEDPLLHDITARYHDFLIQLSFIKGSFLQ